MVFYPCYSTGQEVANSKYELGIGDGSKEDLLSVLEESLIVQSHYHLCPHKTHEMENQRSNEASGSVFEVIKAALDSVIPLFSPDGVFSRVSLLSDSLVDCSSVCLDLPLTVS